MITGLDATTPPASGSATGSSPSAGSLPSSGLRSSGNPMLMADTAAATAGGGGSAAGILTTAGELAEDAMGLAARGAVAAGEGLLATAAFPATVLGGIFWPTSMRSDDTPLTSQAATEGTVVQNNQPDDNAPPPPGISPSGQTDSPGGPEDPDGSPIQRQSVPGQAENATPSDSNPIATTQDVLADSVPDADKPILKDGTLQQTKPGGMTAADADFDRMQPNNIEIRPGGVRMGVLDDGTQVVVRPKSVPSIEINPENGPSYVIRYKG